MSLPEQFSSGLKPQPTGVVRSYTTSFAAMNQSYANASNSTSVRLDLSQLANKWLDPRQSYLKMTITTSADAELDFNAAAVISRLEVYSAGQSNLLESIDQYNLYSNIMWTLTATTIDTAYAYSALAGSSETNARRGATVGTGGLTVCIPLISGVLGLGTDRNIPMVGLTLVITCANSAEAFISGGAVTYTLSSIEYVACLHELSPDVHGLLMSQGGPSGLMIPAVSVRNFVASIPDASRFASINLGGASSVKHWLWVLREAAGIGTTTVHALSNFLKAYLSQWQARVGATLYPPKPIIGTAQILTETWRALHIFSTSTPTIITQTTYTRDVVGQTAGADDPTKKGSFIGGLDFEASIHNKSQVYLGGTNTLNNVQSWADLTFSQAHANLRADFFCAYDLLLVVQNGQISAQY
jgi:hypothetical protein